MLIPLLLGFISGVVAGFVVLPRAKNSKNKANLIRYGTVLDTSALIDGRIFGLADRGYIPRPLLIPSRVVQELRVFYTSDLAKYQRQKQATSVALKWLEAQTDIEYDDAYDDEDADQQVVLQAITHGYCVASQDKEVLLDASKRKVVAFDLDVARRLSRSVVRKGDLLSVKLVFTTRKSGVAAGYAVNGDLVHVAKSAGLIGTSQKVQVTHISNRGNVRHIDARLNSDD